MLIGKTTAASGIALHVAHFDPAEAGSAWQASGADAAIIKIAGPLAADGACAMRLPAQSISLPIAPARR